MPSRQRIVQIAIVAIVQATTVLLLPFVIPGLTITSWPAALGMAAVYTVNESIVWWVFIRFFAWLPAWLYPIITFLLTGVSVMLFGNLPPGSSVAGVGDGLLIVIVLTVVSAILAALLSLDLDEQFDRNVTRPLVARRGHPVRTDEPGFVYLEIDGLSEPLFRRALAEGHLPNLKRWLDRGSHRVLGWETDYSAQTGAMQAGILMGNNDDLPAYRWWDREQRRIVMSGHPRDAKELAARLTNGHGLLAGGGASRGNMFAGDADESTLTIATLLDRAQSRGPGFYLYLFSPYVIARLLTRFFVEVGREWWQQHRQRRRKVGHMVSSRNLVYGFIRAILGPFVQDLVTYQVISDVLRGVPAVYALYPGYDDIAHFCGMTVPEAFVMLAETDRYVARVEKALEFAPRPYHLIVLSDHGLTEGATFTTAHGLSLDAVVKGLIANDQSVLALTEANEAWDTVNAILSESVSADTRTARLLRSALKSRTADGLVEAGPDVRHEDEQRKAGEAEVIVFGSGCSGLIYCRVDDDRTPYEEIQERYPGLVPGLVNHPGIGFVVVHSATAGAMVLGKKGVHFLDQGTVEGEDPLLAYGPNAANHLARHSTFANGPDILVNAAFDPETGEQSSFENQVAHHGGLGGPQNHGFIFAPVSLATDGQPIVGATSVYRLLRGWRDQAAASTMPHPTTTAT